MIEKNKLSEIYDLYSREIYAYIAGYVCIRETAEDLLHDTFVRLINYTLSHDLDLSNIRAFMYKIARNLCIDHARKEKKTGADTIPDETPGRDFSTHGDMEYEELKGKIESLLEKMDEVSRSVFIMRTRLKIPFRDISESLGISERTAKRKMSDTLAYLSKSLVKAGFLLLLAFLMAFLAWIFV
ncbi:MAG: RNA polymerase sigma factor [Spirochaetes bacterium]|jgi:RNA polymerase sigma-70 factor (ECF subfamily)|nr:RNA polymerase sigma factor [Spirochaetota bacterium]